MEGKGFYGSTDIFVSAQKSDQANNFEGLPISVSFDDLTNEQMGLPPNISVEPLSIESEESFNKIYLEFNYPLFIFALKILGNRQDAEDATAEVFYKLWQRRSRYSKIENINGFLYATIRNESITLLKKRNRAAIKVQKFASQVEEVAGPDEITSIRTGYRKKILEELHNLTKSQETVFILACFYGLKNPEIAQKLGISINTVQNHKATAMQKLRRAAVQNIPIVLLFILQLSQSFSQF